jgi:hypothetical protein
MRSYGIDENVKSESGAGGSVLSPGINENITLKDVSYGLASRKQDADANGPKALCFEFANEDGETALLHFEWEINEERELEGAKRLYDSLVAKGEIPKETKQEFVNNRVDKAYSSQASRIKHILTKFMPEEDVIIQTVASFEQYCQMIARLIKPKLDDRKLRLICVYNYKGYITLPSFVPFVENMVDGVATSLKISKYHKITPPVAETAPAKGGAVSDDDEF